MSRDIEDLFEDKELLENEDNYDFDDDERENVDSDVMLSIKHLDEEFMRSEQYVNTGSIDTYQKERVSKVTGKTVTNYVDNDQFCNAITQWNIKRKEAQEAGKPNPPMPDIIGHAIIKIADGLARRFNFRNYTYIDEMREDGIFMAIRAVKNYDPSKSNNNNAFGYFNRVIWMAFTTRIKAEHNQHDIKMSLLKDPMYLGYEVADGNGDNIDKNKMISIYDEM